MKRKIGLLTIVLLTIAMSACGSKELVVDDRGIVVTDDNGYPVTETSTTNQKAYDKGEYGPNDIISIVTKNGGKFAVQFMGYEDTFFEDECISHGTIDYTVTNTGDVPVDVGNEMFNVYLGKMQATQIYGEACLSTTLDPGYASTGTIYIDETFVSKDMDPVDVVICGVATCHLKDAFDPENSDEYQTFGDVDYIEFTYYDFYADVATSNYYYLYDFNSDDCMDMLVKDGNNFCLYSIDSHGIYCCDGNLRFAYDSENYLMMKDNVIYVEEDTSDGEHLFYSILLGDHTFVSECYKGELSQYTGIDLYDGSDGVLSELQSIGCPPEEIFNE